MVERKQALYLRDYCCPVHHSPATDGVLLITGNFIFRFIQHTIRNYVVNNSLTHSPKFHNQSSIHSCQRESSHVYSVFPIPTGSATTYMGKQEREG